jgi:integrase
VKTNLNAKLVEGLKATDKRQEFSDNQSSNLLLVVQPTGTKSWVWRGRMNGAVKKMTLGTYPAHSLADAREWANNVTAGRDNGVNIVEDAKQAAEADVVVDSRTCDWLFDLYMEYEGRSKKSAPEKQRMYNHDIKPIIGSRLVADIEHDDLAKILRTKAKTAPTQSNGLQSLIRRWFKWAVTIGRDLSGLKVNPAVDLVKLSKPKTRERYLNDYEIGLFFKALEDSKLGMKVPMIVTLYTGLRRSEVFEAPWTEIDFAKKRWEIPADRTKNGLVHILPLQAEVMALLEEQKRKTGNHVLIWPSSVGDGTTAMSGFSNAVEAVHSKMVKLARLDGKTVPKWSIHDLRRSLSTGMNGLHDANDEPLIPQHVVERVINHKLGGVAGIYNRYEYLAEKKKALRIWADHLAAIKRLA